VSVDFGSLSREFELLCDLGGTIEWVDPRAARLFGACVGKPFSALAVRGSEDKARGLFLQLEAGPVSRWELALLVGGEGTEIAFHAAREGERVKLVGSLLAADYAAALTELSSTLSEMASLYRVTERQQRALEAQGAELRRLNTELGESNRGIVTLCAELDDKAQSLALAVEMKSQIVSNVSHEFRTPVNSILGLAQLLLDRVDGPLGPEQDKQVSFIRSAAVTLSDMVNDLLDLSKTDAGKNKLVASRFQGSDLFASLRGILRPLKTREGVELVFEQPAGDMGLETDEAKVSQVLRNLISNALKFTERGEVRVSLAAAGLERVTFRVLDTGIGIDSDDQSRIFDEFVQIDSPLQRKVKGTGLGLSLSRKLARLLGGEITVQSEPGRGASFDFTLPAVLPEVREMAQLVERSQPIDPSRSPVLVLEDDHHTIFLYEKYLTGAGFQVVPARSVEEARKILETVTPSAFVLDILLEGETSWSFLSDIKSNPATRDIPVLVVTLTNREQKARALGADEFWLKPVEQDWLLRKLRYLARREPSKQVLVIDDDPVARYLVRRLLLGTPYEVMDASTGSEGVRLARERVPHVILLDFVLPDMTAFDVIDALKGDSVTRSIPVIMHTSQPLRDDEQRRLARDTAALLPKRNLSREVAMSHIREALLNAGVPSSGPAPSGARGS